MPRTKKEKELRIVFLHENADYVNTFIFTSDDKKVLEVINRALQIDDEICLTTEWPILIKNLCGRYCKRFKGMYLTWRSWFDISKNNVVSEDTANDLLDFFVSENKALMYVENENTLVKSFAEEFVRGTIKDALEGFKISIEHVHLDEKDKVPETDEELDRYIEPED